MSTCQCHIDVVLCTALQHWVIVLKREARGHNIVRNNDGDCEWVARVLVRVREL